MMLVSMAKAKRITANLPADLLKEATDLTQEGITETLIRGLKLLKRTAAFEKAQKLRGRIRLDVNLDQSRERPRR